ncbi:adenylate cyclase, terminal-differentiation specific [Onthophagus taurus]|uniref:adenylate cyclase, terminal-differentiation specific n=1 Tax=Onthophagus taurus TaxID=166361 RepID=UPI000C20D97D|nr:DEP domain-containing protein DDB_G0279099 [Onthophagus taurus]
MGCGHSKINIYPKRSRNKNNNKKTVTQEKDESEEEETIENETDDREDVDDVDRKTIKIKPIGGPLLAQKELSSSQQNFFKMLDEKIENGPDYDSSSETEKAAETARLTALLKDWETASAGSRSLPATPKKNWRPNDKFSTIRNVEIRQQQRAYQQQQQPIINQSVVHQSYGVNPHINYHPVYNSSTYHSPPHQTHQIQQNFHQNQLLNYPYQGLVNTQQQQPQRLYNSNRQSNIPHHQNIYGGVSSSAAIPNHVYSNGELIQQQVYTHQLQYQQAREYQQYRQAREQQLLMQQQQRNYQQQSNVGYQSEDSPVLHRNHYEMA